MKKAYLVVPCGTGLQLRSHAQLGSVVSALGRPVRCGGHLPTRFPSLSNKEPQSAFCCDRYCPCMTVRLCRSWKTPQE
jgi:hypothetical protein